MKQTNRRQVLFILGTAHSGSTLLSLMLGSHAQMFALGEISNLPDFHERKRPICDVCEGKCNFWDTQFKPIEQKHLANCLSNQRLSKYIPLKVERQIRGLIGRDQIFKPYTTIFSKLPESTEVLIDSTKTVAWIKQQLQLPEFKTQATKGINPKLLYLVRDGRAIMASYLRRKPQLNMKELSQKWVKRITASQAFFDRFPKAERMCISYEELATKTETTLQKVCDFLELDYAPELVHYWEKEHHFVSGNTGTRSLIQKYRRQQEKVSDMNAVNEAQSQASPKNYKFYAEKVGFQIKLDLRWKSELSLEQIQIFEQIAGEVNQPYAWKS